MKKKLGLDLENLTVDSFETTPTPVANEDGTIVGQATDPFVDNTCQLTCTNDNTCTFTSTCMVGDTCNVVCGSGTATCAQTPLCW